MAEIIINALFTIAAAVIVLLLGWAIVQLGKTGKFNHLKNAIEILRSNCYTVAAALQQEMVEEWKEQNKDGKLTDAEIAHLKTTALTRVMAITAPAFINLLVAAGTDVKELVQNAIQEWVLENHKE